MLPRRANEHDERYNRVGVLPFHLPSIAAEASSVHGGRLSLRDDVRKHVRARLCTASDERASGRSALSGSPWPTSSDPTWEPWRDRHADRSGFWIDRLTTSSPSASPSLRLMASEIAHSTRASLVQDPEGEEGWGCRQGSPSEPAVVVAVALPAYVGGSGSLSCDRRISMWAVLRWLRAPASGRGRSLARCASIFAKAPS
jgi:hypothetical protein